jgi:hypothetical protein
LHKEGCLKVIALTVHVTLRQREPLEEGVHPILKLSIHPITLIIVLLERLALNGGLTLEKGPDETLLRALIDHLIDVLILNRAHLLVVKVHSRSVAEVHAEKLAERSHVITQP